MGTSRSSRAVGRSYAGTPRTPEYLAENFAGLKAADIRLLLDGIKRNPHDVRTDELRAGLARALEIAEWKESR